MRSFLLPLVFIAGTHGQGMILRTIGANGVTAPGACVLDGTPRDCIVNACGAQADTGIIRDAEIRSGQFGPLGWTQGGGNCRPDAVIGAFMGLGPAPRYIGGRNPTGKTDNFESFGLESHHIKREADASHTPQRTKRGAFDLPVTGGLGIRGERTSYDQETTVGDSTGRGKDEGLPTTDDLGQITLIYRQINQEGYGPVTADVDATSAASDPKAFRSAKVVENVPGDGLVGLSSATNTNFKIKVQVPKGMVCQGNIAGLDNVCFVRVRNTAANGPFGGAGFFTQSHSARKRAIEESLE